MKIPQTKRYSIYKNLVLEDERSYKINFNIDGRVYYVYRITEIETKEYYYGYRIQVKEDILDDLKAYGSTSKRKKLIQENTEKYNFKIIRIFNNAGNSIIFESFLHQYFNVKSHDRFFNSSNQTPFGRDTSGRVSVNGVMVNRDEFKEQNLKFHTKNMVSCKNKNTLEYMQATKEEFDNNPNLVGVNYGRITSNKTKDRMSKSLKGRIFSKEHKENLSKSFKNRAPEYFKNLSESQKGKIIPNLVREKISKTLCQEYKIYNELGVEVFHCYDMSFINFCKNSNLPFGSFKKSYQNNSLVVINNKKSEDYYKENIKYNNWRVLKL